MLNEESAGAAAQCGVAIRNLAVATDLSEFGNRVVQHGLAVARHFGSALHFLHLVRPSEFVFAPEMLPALDDAAQRDCDRLIARLSKDRQLDGIQYRCWMKEGEISDIVPDFVRQEQIDLLVIGTHGRGGIPRLLLGSLAQQIFHCVHCPVLTIGPLSPGAGPGLQLKRVLYSTDLSRESLAAVPYVLTAMREWHCELDIVHVCSTAHPGHSSQMDDLNARIRAMLDGSECASPRCQILIGKPAPRVIDNARANHDDLIVLGLKPRRSLYDGPVWSGACEILRHAGCPVLSVRSGVTENDVRRL